MAKKDDFHSIERTDELDEVIHKNRKRIFKIALTATLVVVLIILVAVLWMELRTFKDYELKSSVDALDNNTKKYEVFLGEIVEYSNDGILYRDREWNRLWNQSFEMASPRISICEGFLSIYDMGGTDIYIMNKDGLVKKLEMSKPIVTVDVARQGTVAVLMKQAGVAYVRLYNTDGEELTNGEFFQKQGSFPVDIALSMDARKLAVDMVDISDGSMNTTIQFYNFGSVGQNEVNNEVGSFTFKDALFPTVQYVSNDRLLAIGDSEYAIFDGTQKPTLSGEYKYEQTVQSLFYNNKYLGIIYSNNDDDNTFHIKVMDFKGKTVMEQDTSLPYSSVEFIGNNEVCIRSQYACEIYTIHGIKKFVYTFDNELYKILSGRDSQSYTFVIEKTVEEVRLK